MSLQTFTLADLGQYTKEGPGTIPANADHWLFYVGRDDVHSILKTLLSQISTSLYMNMFGYDDEELNAIIMEKAKDPSITVLVTLDKSQSGGKHEAAILASDVASDPVTFNSHFVIGTSATSQISHTKGGVCDGIVSWEGSTNWSTSGEGSFVIADQAGGTGYKAQNNTLLVFTDNYNPARFTAELIAENKAAALHGKVLTNIS